MLIALILLCIAVIILSIPAPAPWANWIACALAVVALIMAAIGYR